MATFDPFQGYKSAIHDELTDATAVLDALDVVALGTKLSMRSAVGCSRTPPGTAAARATRWMGSRTSCAPGRSHSDRQTSGSAAAGVRP